MSFALIHLFATGPCNGSHGLLQVGVLDLMKPDAGPHIFTLNPGKPYGEALYRRSRISNETAAQSAVWKEVIDEVQALLNNYDQFFFYNELHERAWLQKTVLQGAKNGASAADLSALSSFFLPEKPLQDPETLVHELIEHNKELSQKYDFGRSKPQMPFVLFALREVVLQIIDRLLLPTKSLEKEGFLVWQLFEEALRLHGNRALPPEFRAIQAAAAQAVLFNEPDALPRFQNPERLLAPPPANQTQQHLQHWMEQALPVNEKDLPKTKPDKLLPLQEHHVREAFAAFRNFHNQGHDKDKPLVKQRHQQELYAQRTALALNDGGCYALEAGTGTGKTLGYLTPAAEFIKLNPGTKVVVATATKNLQAQLFYHELPRLLHRGLPYQDLKGALLKGQNNYLCVSALAEVYSDLVEFGKGTAADCLLWLYFALRLRHTKGEIEEIPAFVRNLTPNIWDLWNEVVASETCYAPRCTSFCVYPRHLKTAVLADIVITNHHKLVRLPNELAEAAAACIIDEADHFPDTFREALSEEFRLLEFTVKLLRPILGSPKKKGYLHTLEQWLMQHETEHTPRLLQELELAHKHLHAAEISLQPVQHLPYRSGDQRWLDPAPHRKQNPDEPDCYNELAKIIQKAGELVGIGARKLYLVRENLPDAAENVQQQRQRLQRYQEKAEKWSNALLTIAADFPSKFWIHVLRKERNSWSAARLPYSLEEPMEELKETFPTLIFTSATLYVSESTDFFRYQLNQQGSFSGEVRIKSPFNYRDNVAGAVTAYLPEFAYQPNLEKTVRQEREREWFEKSMATLLALLAYANGRSLVLFTSNEEMLRAYEWLLPRLEPHQIELLPQHGASVWEINRFKKDENSVLLGVDRFWYGVDFPGRTLSQVIVWRLPNPVLSQPLVAHRRQWEGHAFWQQYYYPAGRLKLRQGFGRLIRTEADSGLFVVLDSRLHHQNFLQHYLTELPVRISPVHSEEEMLKWLQRHAPEKIHGLKAELERREVQLDVVKFEHGKRRELTVTPASRPVTT